MKISKQLPLRELAPESEIPTPVGQDKAYRFLAAAFLDDDQFDASELALIDELAGCLRPRDSEAQEAYEKAKRFATGGMNTAQMVEFVRDMQSRANADSTVAPLLAGASRIGALTKQIESLAERIAECTARLRRSKPWPVAATMSELHDLRDRYERNHDDALALQRQLAIDASDAKRCAPPNGSACPSGIVRHSHSRSPRWARG